MQNKLSKTRYIKIVGPTIQERSNLLIASQWYFFKGLEVVYHNRDDDVLHHVVCGEDGGGQWRTRICLALKGKKAGLTPARGDDPGEGRYSKKK